MGVFDYGSMVSRAAVLVLVLQKMVLFTSLVGNQSDALQSGHNKMRSGADLRGGSPLVSFNHVIDPHFVTFSSSLYTTIRNPNLSLTLTRTLT